MLINVTVDTTTQNIQRSVYIIIQVNPFIIINEWKSTIVLGCDSNKELDFI